MAQKSDEKIVVDLTEDQRTLLLELSRVCKENDLLSGQERKALFQAGKYAGWFPNRVEWVSEILVALMEEQSAEEYQSRISDIVTILDELDVEFEFLKLKEENASASLAERFRFAEILLDKGQKPKAKMLFLKLKEQGVDSEDLEYYIGQLSA